MALTKEQIQIIDPYVQNIYETKIAEINNNHIKTVKESDEYKTAKILIENTLSLFIEDTEELNNEVNHALRNIFETQLNNIINWKKKHEIRNAIRAILATLPENSTFEDIVKTVETKLSFNTLINVKQTIDNDEFIEDDDYCFDD